MGLFNFFKKNEKFDPSEEYNKGELEKIINTQKTKYYCTPPNVSTKLKKELNNLIVETEKEIIITNSKSQLPNDPPKLQALWVKLEYCWIQINRTSGYDGWGYFLGADKYSIHYYNALYGQMEMNRSVIFSIKANENIWVNSDELPIQGFTLPIIEKFLP